jgi:outer membrane protein assembly complex protein YaeT
VRKNWRLTLLFPLLLAASRAAETPPKDEEILKILRIQGNEGTSEEELLKILPFHIGDPVTRQKRDLAEKMLLSLLRSNGYLEATVKTSWWNENDEGLFLASIDEGPLYRFGETQVVGLETLPARVVAVERTYEEGDPYSGNELLQTQTRLYLTSLFEDVRIQASTAAAKTADVTIRLNQKELKWIKGGVGWGSEEKERLTLILNHKNLWRRAHGVELLGTVSRIWREYKADYINPYFFDTRTEHRTSFSWRSEDREGYDLERTLGSTGLGRELAQGVRGNVSYQVKRTLLFHVDPEIAAISPERSDSRSVIVALNRNKTNDPFFPTQGTNTELKLERAGGSLGGNIDFNKAALTLRGYRHLLGSLTGAFAVRGGVVREFPPSREVPIFERFFTGGANSVRGYRERGVGPADGAGAPLGGEWLFGSSLEVRFPIVWRLSGALFVDGGQVGPGSGDVDPSRWKFGGGGGIRFRTPVGPIRLDYGYKLNRDRDADPWRIHFSLGESF